MAMQNKNNKYFVNMIHDALMRNKQYMKSNVNVCGRSGEAIRKYWTHTN